MRSSSSFTPPLRRLVAIATFGAIALSSTAHAQLPDFGNFGGFGGGSNEGDVTVTAEFTPPADGQPALLFVTAEVSAGFHIYAVDQGKLPDGSGPQQTKLSIAEPAGAKLLGPWQPLAPPETHVDQEAFVGLELREHGGVVTWFAPIELPADADPASTEVAGLLDAQICDANNCIPVESEFTATAGDGFPLPAGVEVKLADATAPAETAVEPKALDAADVEPAEPLGATGAAAARPKLPPSLRAAAGPEYDLEKVNVAETEDQSVWYYLLIAFAGGIILNVMPCVLPVIGLKVMSFVHQAGESRARALMLNLWYSAGIVAVFLALAALSVLAGAKWGSQFANVWFNVTLLSVVYVMALSMLGVWEIPIPGFVGTGAAMEAAEKEGASAAFLKGILTTLLATPCTAPLMASALTWAVRQPPAVTFGVFAMMGLGMACPYLLIGAFPGLIKFLPKPGMWMETFKNTMGLVLMGTVVWFLSFLDSPLVVPTVAYMLALGAACWWIAQTPNYEPLGKRLLAWTQAGMFAAVAAMGCYGLLYERVMLPRHEAEIAGRIREKVAAEKFRFVEELASVKSVEDAYARAEQIATDLFVSDEPWQPFDLQRLGAILLREKKTVIVDFTADWCTNCKFLENTVLKSDEVESAIAAAGITTMTADFTDEPAWLEQVIDKLRGAGVPLLAIFPADSPYDPIVLHGVYSKDTLLGHLQSLQKTRTASLAPVGR
ncbi:MAG: hypothetical protein CMJ58_17125 [Planctomycetaceae bacterium]|nr:hypothetical protein [Planctomycetaceae bacterium]